MTRTRLAKEITCNILCALTLCLALPAAIVLLLLIAAIDALARLCKAVRR